MNIINRNTETKTVTVELSWDELNHFINEYDKIAGHYLRHNNLAMAMWWANHAKEIKEQQDIARGKKSPEQE
tara:strand:+ start:82 stop:297 length:216 start_codon:yes stop_codon:yes gene_type:complete